MHNYHKNTKHLPSKGLLLENILQFGHLATARYFCWIIVSTYWFLGARMRNLVDIS